MRNGFTLSVGLGTGVEISGCPVPWWELLGMLWF